MNVIIVNDTSGENHTGCNAVMSSYDELCSAYHFNIVNKYTRKNIKNISFDNVDLVIINGEGSIHHNTHNAKFFPRLLDSLTCPAVLINAVWDSVQCMTPEHYKIMNNQIPFVAVRESLSAASLQTTPYKGEIIVVPDLTFYKNITKYNYKREKEGYSDAPFAPSPIEKKEVFLPLMPARPWDDYCRELQKLKHFLTGRFHGACAAIATNTPFSYVTSNTHKIQGLELDLKMAGTKDNYVKLAKNRIKELWNKIYQTFSS